MSRILIPPNATGVPGANFITAWYVNPSVGNDGHDGTSSGSALATTGEVFRRIGRQPIDGNVTPAVTVNISGYDAGTYEVAPLLVNYATLVVQGARTVAWSGTLQAVTVWDGTTQTVGSYRIHSGGVNPDITALGWPNAAFIQDHAAGTTYSPIGKDLGSGTFQGTWLDYTGLSSTEPTVNNAVDVYTLTSGLTGFVAVAAEGATGTVVFSDLVVGGGASSVIVSGEGSIYFFGCQVHGAEVYRQVNGSYFFGSQVLDGLKSYGASVFVSDVALGAVQLYGHNVANTQGNVVIQDGPLTVGSTLWGPGHLSVSGGSLAVIDPNGTAISVEPCSRLIVGNYMWVSNSGLAQSVGIQVYSGGSLLYGAGLLPVVGATDPTTPWSVGGTAKTQAAIAAGFTNAANQAAVVQVS